jgi:phosphate transport system protein
LAEQQRPLRVGFQAELEQLRLQVEVMALLVRDNLDRAHSVLEHGDAGTAIEAIEADDPIDAMLVSLTGRCYDVLGREAPVASDLRFVVSVLRMLEELERIGDLALRVVKLQPHQDRLASNPETFGILLDMSAEARRLYDLAVSTWSSQRLEDAQALVVDPRHKDALYARLMAHILDVSGPDAVPVAVTTLLAGRALERIADHTVIVGERLRFLLTGDPAYLASEIR